MKTSLGGACGAIAAMAVGAMLVGMSGRAVAQCEERWLPETAADRVEGGGHLIAGMTMWDPDGAGPLPAKLVIAGSFATAGGVAAANLASWDGVKWEAIGGGTNGYLAAVVALADGRLVVAGKFTLAGEVSVSNIAMWDGVAWSALAEGLSGSQPLLGFQVNALCADGNGGLYAAGAFATAGTTAVNNIAHWDGSVWSALGTGLSGVFMGQPWVSSLLLLPGGEVLAGGSFSDAGGHSVKSLAKWDGTSWSDVGGGVLGTVWCMTRASTGSLFVGGDFSVTTGTFQTASNIAEWNGTQWKRLGAGVRGSGDNGTVRDIVVLESGSVLAGGTITATGGLPLNSIARWDGTAWAQIGTGLPSAVQSMILHPSGEVLVGRDATSSANKAKVFSRHISGETAWLAEQPRAATAPCRGSGVFEAQLANGYDVTGALWYRGEEQLVHNPAAGVRIEIEGGLSRLRLDNVSLAVAGEYRCVLSTACTEIKSAWAELSVTGTCCVADLNLDGEVNDADFTLFVAAYDVLTCDDALMAPGCPADFNGDGVVDDEDFSAFVHAYDEMVCA